MFLRVCSTVFSLCAACEGVNLSVTTFVPRRIRAESNALVPRTTLGCSPSPAAATLSVAFVTITTTHRDNPTQIKLITFVLVDIITVLPVSHDSMLEHYLKSIALVIKLISTSTLSPTKFGTFG